MWRVQNAFDRFWNGRRRDEIRHYRCAVMYIQDISGHVNITCDQSCGQDKKHGPFQPHADDVDVWQQPTTHLGSSKHVTINT
jgi:hypothetical protein